MKSQKTVYVAKDLHKQVKLICTHNEESIESFTERALIQQIEREKGGKKK